jgi:hypothetical protein
LFKREGEDRCKGKTKNDSKKKLKERETTTGERRYRNKIQKNN